MSRTLKLTCKKAKQNDDKLESEDVRYGFSLIKLVSGDDKGRAEWKDDENSAYDGGVDVFVLGGRKLHVSERTKRSILVASRPRQAEFRDALIQLDEQCVLTGAKCREALEAAHLVPVARKGQEQIENGILWRADLHLLFDAGLIWFRVSDDHAVADCSSGDEYVRDLKGRRLPDKAFQRVKAALLERAKLLGGRGRDTTT